VPGVDPTNNAAERALRQAVIWRKPGFPCRGNRLTNRLETDRDSP
jgi:hypothetical protein